tara:strand:- start:553 stop:741 length:189 start_codon:yes stop_codon:yes gene_type:complete
MNKKTDLTIYSNKEYILYTYDIELQTLNDLLIKKQIKKSKYNKLMKYNNKMLKIELNKIKGK